MTKVLVVNLLNNELFPTPYSPIKMTFCSGTFTDAIVNKMAYYNFLNAHDNLNFNQTSARPQSSKFQKIVSTGDFSVTLSVKSVSCVYIVVSLLEAEGREIWSLNQESLVPKYRRKTSKNFKILELETFIKFSIKGREEKTSEKNNEQ